VLIHDGVLSIAVALISTVYTQARTGAQPEGFAGHQQIQSSDERAAPDTHLSCPLGANTTTAPACVWALLARNFASHKPVVKTCRRQDMSASRNHGYCLAYTQHVSWQALDFASVTADYRPHKALGIEVKLDASEKVGRL
jgi:hypothetical protein